MISEFKNICLHSQETKLNPFASETREGLTEELMSHQTCVVDFC